MKELLFPVRLKAWQLRGKMRRFLKTTFPSLNGHEPRRYGSCSRCGACCKIVYRCPFLVEKDGLYGCGIYERRPQQCRHYPVESQDIYELESGCTYYFLG